MKRVLLLALVLALLGAGSAQGSHRVTLDAYGAAHSWESLPMLKSVPVSFRIYSEGRQVHQHGVFLNRCRYSLMTRRLAIDIRFCHARDFSTTGKERIRLRYIGSARFTFVFRADPD